MVIDIIDLNDPDFADLTAVQLAMVRAAQAQKDEILLKCAEEKNTRFRTLLGNGTVRSSMRRDLEAELDRKAEHDVDVVREDLLYQLAYEERFSGGNEYGPYSYPENPDYTLAAPQRFLVVREYYMRVTTNPKARLEAYAMDSLARVYLGEYYQTLYDLLASYVSS